MNKVPVELNNVTLYWASLAEPNTMSGKYQVDLCQLTEEQVGVLEDIGLNVRTKGDDRGYFVTAKSAKFPITPYLKDGGVFEGMVANGSKADVKAEAYQWTHAPTKRSGWAIGIKIGGLTLTDAIEYTPQPVVAGEEAL
jgi:hypothetical protein